MSYHSSSSTLNDQQQQQPPQNIEGDLIDLNVVGSPIFAKCLDTSILQPLVYDTLIDSELPVLEQKLQTTSKISDRQTSQNLPLEGSTSKTVDVEDILITIDDDNSSCNSSISSRLRRSNSVEILSPVYDNHGARTLDKSWSCDNLEALGVLSNLDDILDASLIESNRILNIASTDEAEDSNSASFYVPEDDLYCQQTMDCLLDLDQYLQNLDTSSSTSRRSSLTNKSSIQELTPVDGDFDTNSDYLDDYSLRENLRQMEENYVRFLATSRGCINRGYVGHPEEFQGSDAQIGGRNSLKYNGGKLCNKRRPLSASGTTRSAGRPGHAFSRSQPGRATVAVVRRFRPDDDFFVRCTNSSLSNRTSATFEGTTPSAAVDDNNSCCTSSCSSSSDVMQEEPKQPEQEVAKQTSSNDDNNSDVITPSDRIRVHSSEDRCAGTINVADKSPDIIMQVPEAHTLYDPFDRTDNNNTLPLDVINNTLLLTSNNSPPQRQSHLRVSETNPDTSTTLIEEAQKIIETDPRETQIGPAKNKLEVYDSQGPSAVAHATIRAAAQVETSFVSAGLTPVVSDTASLIGAPSAGTWLRSSMRRLRPLDLMPSDVAADDMGSVQDAVPGTATVGPAANTSPIELLQAERDNFTNPQNLHSDYPDVLVRPLSAPSRLVFPSFVDSAGGNSSSATNNSVGNNLVQTEGDLISQLQLQQHRTRSRSRSRNSHGLESGERRARSSSASSRSRSVSSLASTVDSTPSCTPAATPTRDAPGDEEAGNARRSCDRQQRPNDMPDAESPLGQWPHSLSSIMACLGCTLGLFNISRFAILSVHFGANFIFQFLLLSLIFGLPLFTLQLCLGQQLGAGVIDMWGISPLFQGVGVALLLANALVGLYSIIGVSWMFVFFRDSFITKTDRYRWAEPYVYYRRDIQPPVNGTYKLSETIPDYFSGIVLQRHHLAYNGTPGTIKFQLAFNLAVVWMIVFVSLSKGLRSYGKVVYVFTLVPVFGTSVLCAKILGMMPPEFINMIFPETNWGEFFLNPKSWLAATQEVFLTWGLLGAAVMQIASHNKHKHLLQRDSSLVAIITCTVLLLVAFLANTCVQVLKSAGYNYMPNSFERMSSYVFLRPVAAPLPPSLANTPVRYMVHNSFILGQKVVRPGADYTQESGYQALSLATELVPATFAILGPDQVSPFWAVLFYFVLILFGIAQQLAIWHCVITGIMAIKVKVLRSWETTITLFSCACGFVLGLPMATEFGIYVVYFMDYTVGNIWWLAVVILLQIIAVFMVRGRPYSGDTVVTALFTPSNHPCILSWAPALLSFIWNVILPVALMACCITTFRNGNFREMFIWHHAPVAEYWPLWARQIGSILQMTPVLLVPFVAVIQSYRYLNNGPSDILDRIQLLYRPPIGEHMTDLAVHELASATIGNHPNASTTPTTAPSTTTVTVPNGGGAVEDPPPKYTPPPSYTTATGARIAKFLRQSLRRSVRRIANVLGESSSSAPSGSAGRSISRHHPQTQSSATTSVVALQLPPPPPPPDYNAVLVEMNQQQALNNNNNQHHHHHHHNRQIQELGTVARSDVAINIPPRVQETANGSGGSGSNSTGRSSDESPSRRRLSTLERLRTLQPTPGSPTLTAAEVASILRSSFRRSTISRSRRHNPSFSDTEIVDHDTAIVGVSLSAENLVESAAPIGETSLVMERERYHHGDALASGRRRHDDATSSGVIGKYEVESR